MRSIRKTGASVNRWFWQTRLGLVILRVFVRLTQNHVFSSRTSGLMQFDALRLQARLNTQTKKVSSPTPRLHLGCGSRVIPGWMNVDVVGGNMIVDLASGELPWHDGTFETVVSQQVIEHLDLFTEVIPLLREVRRVCKPGAAVWLGCPDLEKACKSYVEHEGADLLEDFITRFPRLVDWREIPSQMINSLFHQDGEYKNLFDLRLLTWACNQAGLVDCRRVSKEELTQRFPEFPARGDDPHSIYVCVRVPSAVGETSITASRGNVPHELAAH